MNLQNVIETTIKESVSKIFFFRPERRQVMIMKTLYRFVLS